MRKERSRATAAVGATLALLVSMVGVAGASVGVNVEETCIENPYGARDLFLRGGFNGWGVSPSYRLVYNCNRFELLFEATGSYEFKVADANWSSTTDFGSAAGAPAPQPGTPVQLALAGGNLSFAFTGRHFAVLDVSLSATEPTLRIDACGTSPLGDAHLDLIGDFEGAGDGDPFLFGCDAYYKNVDIEGLQEFKVGDAAGGADRMFGSATPGAMIAPNEPYPLVSDAQAGGEAANLRFDFQGEHTLRLAFDEEGDPELTIGPKTFVNPGIPVPVTDPVARSVQFDSRSEDFKTPYGAVTAGSEIEFALASQPGVSEATLVVERRRFEGNADVIEYLDPVRVPMTRVAVSDDLDRWTASHQFDNVNVYAYYFELAIGGKNYVYTNNDVAIYWTAERGSFGQGRIAFAPTDPDAINRYRQTVYSADYTVPDYAADIVYYYVFPERFRNGDPANDPQPGVDTYLGGPIEAHDDWLSRPYVPGSGDGSDSQWNNDFFGGDLDGLIEKLDYLQELGVNAIYSTPIFEAGSNHKYDTGDYLNIDGNFGTNEDFETLTREAAARGIRVIVDVSLNHSGSDSVYFDRYSRYDDLGAYEGGTVAPASPWADFYQFNGNSYVGWAGFDTLPELAESDAWKEFAFRADDSVTDTWLDRGASGWRMDVTPWVSDDFWREWRQNVKANDPNALTVAETWFDASKYFLGDTFDSTMNYIFRNSVMDFARGQDAAAVYENIELMREAYPPQAFYALMNLLSTHDAARALHEFGYTSADSPAEAIAAAKQRLRLAVLFQMTFPGAPTVFYGDEVGVRGGPDPDNRATYPWADLGGTPDTALLDDFKELIALRHDNDVLRRGTIGAPLHLDENVIVLAREYDGVLAITAYNNGTAAREVTVEVPAEFADRQMKDALTGSMVAVDGDQLTLAVPAVAGTVLISQSAPDTTRPAVTLVSPSTEGPFRQLRVRVDASDEGGLKRIVANVYRDGSLVKSTQSPMGGAKTGSHTATVSLPDGRYTVRYNAHDLAGNVSRTGTFAFVIDATKPTATVKAGANFTVRSGNAFEMVSYKLHDAGKIDRIELNGVVKDLTNNPWSDVNFIRPGVFGAVRGTNTLRVYDVAGNWRVYRFTLV